MAPSSTKASPEIDAYLSNAKRWEVARKAADPEDDVEASEEIAAVFGEGSVFHKTHSFYIDGVDETTARLPDGWEKRAIYSPVDVDGRTVLAIAPCPEDIIVSKLARLDEKDKEFIEAYHAVRPLDRRKMEQLIAAAHFEPEISTRAVRYVGSLTDPK
jgi:hypothetical protein